MNNRYIPSEVRYELRKEAYFGCAKCGSPILEYHHIVPFAEKQHNNPSDMIALCPTCHRSLGKMRRDKCYALKKNPYNRAVGKIKGELSDRHISAFLLGSNTFIDTPVILSFFGQPIIRYAMKEGQFRLSVYIPRDDMWPDILIEDNDLLVNTGGKWDVEFRTDFLSVKKKERETYFKIDLRKSTAEVEARIAFLGET